MSGGMVPGCNEKGQEAIGGHQRRKNKQAKMNGFRRSPAWTCDDHHPEFSLTFNVRAVEIQILQLHELSNIRWNGSWQVVGRGDAVGGRKRRKNKFDKKQNT